MQQPWEGRGNQTFTLKWVLLLFPNQLIAKRWELFKGSQETELGREGQGGEKLGTHPGVQERREEEKLDKNPCFLGLVNSLQGANAN